MQYFNIFYHYKNVFLNAVKEAVTGELSGPRKVLSYREIRLKIKQKKKVVKVIRNQVYDAMTDVDLEGLTLWRIGSVFWGLLIEGGQNDPPPP